MKFFHHEIFIILKCFYHIFYLKTFHHRNIFIMKFYNLIAAYSWKLTVYLRSQTLGVEWK